MNSVHLVGHLGADPEVRFTNDGKAVANIRVATNEGKDQVEWHRVTCWEKTAELVAEYCKKGKLVGVIGRLRTSEYEDKDGVKRWSTEIVANRVEFLGGRQDGDAAPAGDNDAPPAAAPRASSAPRASAGSAPTNFPNYGRGKNGPIAGASQEDLDYYAAGARRTLADQNKARWHDNERALLDAIEAEQARQTGGPRTGDSRGPEWERRPQPGAPGPSDDDIPF